MSFIRNTAGKGFEAGYFLAADESCTRLTKTISANHAQAVTRTDGTKYVPAGAVIPANGSTAVGLLYEDIDVTDGDAAGSVVTEGTVYKSLLPAAPVSAAITAMKGITFIDTVPAITRPTFES